MDNLTSRQQKIYLLVSDGFKNSLLETAAILGRVEIVKFLLSQLKDDSFQPIGLESFGSALLKAVPFQNIDIIKAFLEKYRKFTSLHHAYAQQLNHALIVRSAIESFKGNLDVFALLFNFVELNDRQRVYQVLSELLDRPRNANDTGVYAHVFSIATPHMNMNDKDQKNYCLDLILKSDNEYAYAALSQHVSLNIQDVLKTIKYRNPIRIINYIFHSPNFELEPVESRELLKNALITFFKNYILSEKSAEKLKTEFNEIIHLFESAVEKAKIENFYSSQDRKGNTLLHSLCDSIYAEEALSPKDKNKIKTILYFLLNHGVDLTIRNNKNIAPENLMLHKKARRQFRQCLVETQMKHQHQLELSSLMAKIKFLEEENNALKRGIKRKYDQTDPVTPIEAKKTEATKLPKLNFFDTAAQQAHLPHNGEKEEVKEKEKEKEVMIKL